MIVYLNKHLEMGTLVTVWPVDKPQILRIIRRKCAQNIAAEAQVLAGTLRLRIESISFD